MGTNRAQRKKTKKSAPRRRYKNALFLKQLGQTCKSLRSKMNYSIDRLSKESDQLSPASIDRLERGLADSQILVLARYAETLGLPITDLFSFTHDSTNLLKDHRIIPFEKDLKTPPGYYPVYKMESTLDLFQNSAKTQGPVPIGWVDSGLKSSISSDHFVVFVSIEAMQPLIPKNSLVVFKKCTGAPRLDKVLLLQASGFNDPETGLPLLIRKYSKILLPQNGNPEPVITLTSENTSFDSITLAQENEQKIRILAEFIRVLK